MKTRLLSVTLLLCGFVAGMYLGAEVTSDITRDIEIAAAPLALGVVEQGPLYARVRGVVRVSASSQSSLTVDVVSPFNQDRTLPLNVLLDEKTTVMREGAPVLRSAIQRGDNITIVIRRAPGRLRATSIFIHTPTAA